jgi:hypothetical protein
MEEMNDILKLVGPTKGMHNTLFHLLGHFCPLYQDQHLDHLSACFEEVFQHLLFFRYITHGRKSIVSRTPTRSLRLGQVEEFAITLTNNPIGNQTDGYTPLGNPLQLWGW